jgi:hypothetical protein
MALIERLLNRDFEVLLRSKSTFMTAIVECINPKQEKAQIRKSLTKPFD